MRPKRLRCPPAAPRASWCSNGSPLVFLFIGYPRSTDLPLIWCEKTRSEREVYELYRTRLPGRRPGRFRPGRSLAMAYSIGTLRPKRDGHGHRGAAIGIGHTKGLGVVIRQTTRHVVHVRRGIDPTHERAG